LNEYQFISNKHSVNLIFDILKQQESSQQSLTRLSVDNGFLIILNEDQHYSDQDLQSLLITSHKLNIPMIGNKVSDSKNAALASVYTPYESLAKETAFGLQKVCDKYELPQAKYGESFAVAINRQIAKSLKYDTIDANKLSKVILNLEKTAQIVNGKN